MTLYLVMWNLELTPSSYLGVVYTLEHADRAQVNLENTAHNLTILFITPDIQDRASHEHAGLAVGVMKPKLRGASSSGLWEIRNSAWCLNRFVHVFRLICSNWTSNGLFP